jgi:protocatechuate 3,4-dioxygenase beta subunit
MGHVSVMALTPQTQDQRRVYNIMQATTTDEKGEYRLFWLPPGRYYVAAKVEDLQKRTTPYDQIPPGRRGPYLRAEVPFVTRQLLPDGDVAEYAVAVVYNGGALDPALAQPIDVRPGATSTGIDIPMAAGKLRSHHIRGRVLNTEGKPAKGTSVTAIPRQFSAVALMLRGSTDNNGAFDLEGAVPGSYSLFASTTAQDTSTQPTPVPSNNQDLPKPELGYLTVDMGNSDLENVRIATTTGWTLPVRVVIEGHNVGNDPDMSRFQVVLTRDPDSVGAPPGLMPLPKLPNGMQISTGPESAHPDASGGASLLVAPGDYRVSMTGFTAKFYMKSIRIGGNDVWNNGLHLVSPPESTLEIVVGTDSGEITGVLKNDKMELVTNAVLALVPQSPLLRFRSATSDGDGKFRFPTVPPGTYKLFAWEYADPQAWQDTEFRRPYESAAKTIEVRPGGKVDTQLTVMPRR